MPGHDRYPDSLDPESQEAPPTSWPESEPPASKGRALTNTELLAVAIMTVFDALDTLVANQARQMHGQAPAYEYVPSGWADRLERELKLRGITRG